MPRDFEAEAGKYLQTLMDGMFGKGGQYEVVLTGFSIYRRDDEFMLVVKGELAGSKVVYFKTLEHLVDMPRSIHKALCGVERWKADKPFEKRNPVG